MSLKIALAGNPNSGKTTMFNILTGSSQYVGNWPGVTVEKKEGSLKNNKDIVIIDLPGIYSLSPYTLEEVITREYLVKNSPDVILNIVDATNIERNLYLTTQIIEMGIPVVIALNMMDIVRKNKDEINISKLEKSLGCSIVETSALKSDGINEAVEKGISKAKEENNFILHIFSDKVNDAVIKIENLLPDNIAQKQKYWYSVKIFERDEKVLEEINFNKEDLDSIEKIISAVEEEFDDTSESIIAFERYEFISGIIEKSVDKKNKSNMTVSDKIDRIVTNRWLALPIFAIIMWFVYYISVSSLGAVVTDWTNDILFGEIIGGGTEVWFKSMGVAPWLQSFVIDGIIGGVGAVLGFVPQMLILFFFLSLLEDCGYMARVAFIMDRIFRKFGLSGKSFIPMLISSGCGVPGIMASRTIENEKDRRMTIMVTTFIPCGAKLPIIALISASLFGGSPLVAPSIYFLGVAMVIFSGIVLKKTRLFKGEPAPFIMELPKYHMPSMKGVLIHMWERSKAFIIKAGTVIFVACSIIWFLSNFNFFLQMVDTSDSILAFLGNIIAPVFKPLGFGTWQASVATITGLVAKENVVGTMAVLFGLGEVAEDNAGLILSIAGSFNVVSAYAFMVFNMLCAPCFAAIGAIKREMGGWKWTLITVSYQTFLAYAVALIVNQLGSVIFLSAPFSMGTLVALVLFGIMIYLLFRKGNLNEKVDSPEVIVT